MSIWSGENGEIVAGARRMKKNNFLGSERGGLTRLTPEKPPPTRNSGVHSAVEAAEADVKGTKPTPERAGGQAIRSTAGPLWRSRASAGRERWNTSRCSVGGGSDGAER